MLAYVIKIKQSLLLRDSLVAQEELLVISEE